ncbi:hypothetical protein ES705_21133 [subsurface metagenome]
MSEVKQKWRSVGLPSVLFNRIAKVIKYTTQQSVAEYVRYAILQRIKYDEAHADETREAEQEIRERLQ